MSEVLIASLLLLNVFQMLFWGYQCQRLINKIMSRSYAEYHQIVNPPKEDAPKLKSVDDSLEEQHILAELNGLFKPVDRPA